MTTLQQKLVNRVRSLEDLHDVNVEISEDNGQIDVSHRLHHVADFKLKWVPVSNYYAGILWTLGETKVRPSFPCGIRWTR